MSRVRELEGGEEILSNSFKLYHFLGVAIKEDLGSLSSRAGWIQGGKMEGQANQ